MTTYSDSHLIHFQTKKWLDYALWAAVGAGILSFIIGLIAGAADKVWPALLVNTLFFSGLAYGCLIFSVIFTITGAKWGRPIKRLAEATILFIPVSWLLFAVLLFGVGFIYEWVDPSKSIPAKHWWLNLPFFISRNLFFMIATGTIGIFYVRNSITPDIHLSDPQQSTEQSFLIRLLANNKSQLSQETSAKKQGILAPIYAIFYTVTACLIAFDWIMSIDQEWYSTVFGFQYAIANFFAAAGFLVIVSSIVRHKLKLTSYFTPKRHNDLSRLLFAASLFWTYLIYSQILVIWYANLPEETPYLLLRMRTDQWSWMFTFLSITLLIIPFFGLLSRKACRSYVFSSVIAAICLIGLWFEKYFLTIPSIQENFSPDGSLPGFSFSTWELFITLGIAACFLQCYLYFLNNVPILPIADPLLNKKPSKKIQ